MQAMESSTVRFAALSNVNVNPNAILQSKDDIRHDIPVPESWQ